MVTLNTVKLEDVINEVKKACDKLGVAHPTKFQESYNSTGMWLDCWAEWYENGEDNFTCGPFRDGLDTSKECEESVTLFLG